MAKLLIVAGLVLVGLGAAMWAGLPLGRLPGDVTVQRGSFTFYFPLATCIVVSLVLTLLFSLLRR
jgi:predicted MFS family arabinose efflux permease